MKYKIILSTYDVEIIKALDSLGNKKSKFVEIALTHFLKSKKCRETLKILTGADRKQTTKKPMKKKSTADAAKGAATDVVKGATSTNDKNCVEIKKINLDKFL